MQAFRVATMEENGIPTITIIGTCRVHHTFRAIEKNGLVRINNGGLDSFVHTTPEILLRLAVMQRKATYDKKLVKLQVGESKSKILEPVAAFNLTESDAIIIEVSSIKTLSADSKALQTNEVIRHLCTPYEAFGKELRDNINLTFNQRLVKVPTPGLPQPIEFSERYAALLEKLEGHVQTEEAITADLEQLLSLSGLPVMFVNHINLHGENGKPITSRNKLCGFVNKFAKNNHVLVFNPSELINDFSQEELLMNEGKDLNHYAKDILAQVGRKQLSALQPALKNIKSNI